MGPILDLLPVQSDFPDDALLIEDLIPEIDSAHSFNEHDHFNCSSVVLRNCDVEPKQ
jgi:hypothetical protein